MLPYPIKSNMFYSPVYKVQLLNGKELFYDPWRVKFLSKKSDMIHRGIPTDYFDRASKDHYLPKSPKIIKLYLGDACNFNCSYCRQDQHTPRIWIRDRLQNLLEILADKDLSQLKRVEYWGGEPFLYWDDIKFFHNGIDKLKSNVTMHLTTNGSLLTGDILKYLIDRVPGGYIYKLSHDGPGQSLRTKDPLEDPKLLEYHRTLFEKSELYKHQSVGKRAEFYINSVLTDKNQDVYRVVKYFKDKFGSEDIQIRKLEPVIPYNDSARKFMIEDFQTFSKNLYDQILRCDIVKNVKEYQDQWTLFRWRMDNPYFWNPMENKCLPAQQITWAIDTSGELLPCQVWTNHSLGRLDHPGVENIPLSAKYTPYVRSNLPELNPDCMDCLVSTMCRGVCSYLGDLTATRLNCEMRYATYKALFKAFVRFYFGSPVTDIELIERWQLWM